MSAVGGGGGGEVGHVGVSCLGVGHPSWKVLSLVLRVPTSTGKPGKMRQLFPVREKSGNFEKKSKSQGILNESGKNVIHKLKFNQSRIKILLNFYHENYPKIPFLG